MPPSPRPCEPPLLTVGIVLAAGAGSRVGGPVPKQLLPLAGRPVLAHALDPFEAAPEVDEVLVVMMPGFLADAERVVADEGFRKVTRVIAGGQDRTASCRAALGALGPQECNVLVHDAARPLLSAATLRACVEELRSYDAVCVAIPSTDTVLVVVDGRVVDVPDRSLLRRAQTPQAFRLSTLRRAHERAAAAGASATDDCTLVLRYCPDVEIRVVPGSERALKITSPDDLTLVTALLSPTPKAADGPGAPAP